MRGPRAHRAVPGQGCPASAGRVTSPEYKVLGAGGEACPGYTALTAASFPSTQIRSQSKASGAGLREGDQVVSINGSPCADLTYPQVIRLMERVTDSLEMLVRRYAALVGARSSSWGQRGPPEPLSHVCGGPGCSAGGLCGYTEAPECRRSGVPIP